MRKPVINPNAKAVPVRLAVKLALYYMQLAKTTHNRELYGRSRGFFQMYWHKRNSGVLIMNTPAPKPRAN